MTDYYDMDGNPITVLQWGERYEDYLSRVLGHDEVDGFTIITVWIGVDYERTNPHDPPLIFGSAIGIRTTDPNASDPDRRRFHLESERRYATKEVALAGHADLVASIRDGLFVALLEGQAGS